MSQAELSSHGGLSQGYLSQLENDEVQNPSAAVIFRLAQALNVPVEFWDERFSSVLATEILRDRGQHGRGTRDGIDATAAAVILQSYLDAQEPSVEH